MHLHTCYTQVYIMDLVRHPAAVSPYNLSLVMPKRDSESGNKDAAVPEYQLSIASEPRRGKMHVSTRVTDICSLRENAFYIDSDSDCNCYSMQEFKLAVDYHSNSLTYDRRLLVEGKRVLLYV